MSISKLDLLLSNFPATKYLEEALYLQAVNHLLIGDAGGSSDYLSQLRNQFPDSRFQAAALKAGGDNAITLERWAEARDSYSQYLAVHTGTEEAPRVGLNLARCHWELQEYEAAQARIEAVLASGTEDKLLLFESRLLLARVLSRLGRYDESASLTDQLDDEAEVYQKDGEVALAKAEDLIARGRPEEAAPLIETIPSEWKIGAVAARSGEMLGRIYLDQWRIEEAQEQYRLAAGNPTVLDDPDGVRIINTELARYILAEQRLDTAREDQAPTHKLTKANVLLFYLDRPRLALDLYLEVADAAAADSSAAVRGLYGAALVYGGYLALPDSADVMAARLVAEYPASPHTHMATTAAAERDLYAYLMELDRREAAQLAAAGPGLETASGPDGVRDEERPDAVADDSVRRSRWRLRKLLRNG
jgi:thioredoxin-like negative regulator of GroEL